MYECVPGVCVHAIHVHGVYYSMWCVFLAHAIFICPLSIPPPTQPPTCTRYTAGTPPTTPCTCSTGVLITASPTSPSRPNRSASNSARKCAPARIAACTACGVTSSAKSVGSNNTASWGPHTTTPSVVAAAKPWPAGDSATPRVRRRARPRVPGSPVTPAAVVVVRGMSSGSSGWSLIRPRGPASVMVRVFMVSSTPSREALMEVC